MPPPEKNHLRQFLLLVFVLLIPCFALWSFMSAWLATPVIGLTHTILSNWFPDIVYAVYQQGTDATLVTRLDEINGQLVPSATVSESLGFRTNTRIVSYSIAFFATLHFATEKKTYLADFFWGMLALYPFILLGLISTFLKDLMTTLGPTFFEQPGVMVPGPNIIGIVYQLSALIIPTLIPILIWAWQSRETALMRSLLRTPETAAGPGP